MRKSQFSDTPSLWCWIASTFSSTPEDQPESFQKKCARGDSRAHSEEDMEKVTSTLKKSSEMTQIYFHESDFSWTPQEKQQTTTC
jgi:hypothetical protein